MHNSTKRKGGTLWRAAISVALGAAALATAAPAFGVGGPVILGGDDLQDHGSFDPVANVNVEGWLYIQKALENISPKVGRVNDGSVAAIGAADAPAALGNDCGGAIGHAAAQAGLPVTYHNEAGAINGLFTEIAAGTARPRIIWIAGVGTGNCMDTAEIAALAANAPGIDAFVNQGGGLMSHGDDGVYGTPTSPGWLNALIPGIAAVGGGSSGDLELTAAGSAAFPGLTNTDVNAGPWHNHFTGDLGGLDILVRTNVASDLIPLGSAVVLGGGQVSLTLRPADLALTKIGPATAQLNGPISYTITVSNPGANPATDVKVSDVLPAGLAFVSATPSQGSCAGGGTVTCSLGDLAPGASGTITLNATATSVGVITNTASVSSAVPDPNAVNDRGSASTTVSAPTAVATGTLPASLKLTITGPARANAGTVVVYRLKVTNTSGQTATSVRLRNPIPSGFVIAQRTKGARLVKAANSWAFGDMAAGASRTVSVKLRLDRAASGSKCLTGQATATNATPANGRKCTNVIRVAGVSVVPVTG